MVFPNFKEKCKIIKKYEKGISRGCKVKNGIIYFCGVPASYISYQIFSVPHKKLPSIESARANPYSVARSYDSFRPDMYKKLKKTKVYQSKFVFDENNILLYVTPFDDEGEEIETFFYTPII